MQWDYHSDQEHFTHNQRYLRWVRYLPVIWPVPSHPGIGHLDKQPPTINQDIQTRPFPLPIPSPKEGWENRFCFCLFNQQVGDYNRLKANAANIRSRVMVQTTIRPTSVQNQSLQPVLQYLMKAFCYNEGYYWTSIFIKQLRWCILCVLFCISKSSPNFPLH